MSTEEIVENALNEAQQAETEQAESPETPDEGQAAATEAEAPSPETPAVQDEWRFPGTREQYEALLQDAQVGREFAPHADQIRATFKRGLAGGYVKGSPAEKQADEDEEVQKYFGSHAAWSQFCNDMKADHNVFVRGVESLVSRARRGDAQAICEIQKQNEALRNEMVEIRGFTRLASHRFEESKKWKDHGKTVTELFEKGLINVGGDLDKAIAFAFEYAEKAAKAQGATRAQAAQAGQAAAKAVAQSQGASPAAATKAAAAAKPSPRREASLEEGKRATKSTNDDDEADEKARKSRLNSRHEHTRLAEWAVAKAMKSEKK